MKLIFDERASDSPFVEKLWRTHSESADSFISLSASNSELVITKYMGQTGITLRGPETKASPAEYPSDAEFFGIVLRLGTFMPQFPAISLMNRHDIHLPEASSKTFWLNGASWEFPSFDNADAFVNRLIRDGVLVRDPVVVAALQDQPHDLTIRSVRRRFLRATGLTRSHIRQIERARRAFILLQQGTSILDTVFEAGYYDQPHLTKALKHYMGHTPAQILGINDSSDEAVEMSLLYKTQSLG